MKLNFLKSNKHVLFFCFFLTSLLSINAQKLTEAQLERQKNKVDLFTSEERDNLQLWFYEKVNEMELTPAKREEYFSVILYYGIKMDRLNDKDMRYTKDEIEEKFESLVERQDVEIKKILTKEKYAIHLEHYNELLRSVRNRMIRTN